MQLYNRQIKYTYGLIYLLGLGLLVYANWYGIGFTFDSHDYWNAALHLDDFLSKIPIEDKIIKRPPLFPVLLSLLSGFGLSAVRLFMLAMFSASAYLMFRLTNLQIENTALKLLCFAVFALSIPIHLMHSFLWTEGLITLVLLAQLTILLSAENTSVIQWVGITFLGMAGAITKNGYMLAVPVIALCLILANQNWKGVVYAALFVFFIYVTQGLVSSYFSGVEATANRVLSHRELHMNYVNVISGWFIPLVVPFWIRLMALILIFLGLMWLYIKSQLFRNKTVNITCALFFGYFLFRTYYSTIDYHESERYLSVGFPVFVLAFMMILDKGMHHTKSKMLKYSTFAFTGIWLLYSLARTINNDVLWHVSRSIL